MRDTSARRVALVTATRGDGGQNEIGTEIFDALGVLRTEELLAAHRFDGAEQYFTRAVDFGYSFSQQETLEKWGHQEILGDFVRHIRTLRPDVIVSLSPDGTGGGQHHQASAILATEAFRAAADPSQFPEQLRDGLRPWQAREAVSSGGVWRPVGRGGPGRSRQLQDPAVAARRWHRLRPGWHLRHTRCERLRAVARLHDRRKSAASRRACTCARAACRWCRLPAPTGARYRLFDTTLSKAQPVARDVAVRRNRRVARGLARFAGERRRQR